MIDEELLSKFDRIQDLPVSEEMLGAYLEGNLSDSESIEVSTMIDTNPDLSFIFFETDALDTDIISDSYSFEGAELISTDFDIPEINDVESIFKFPEVFNGIEAAAIYVPQMTDDINGFDPSEITTNTDIFDNNVQLHDSSEMDYQSLDTDSNSETNEDILNDNLNF